MSETNPTTASKYPRFGDVYVAVFNSSKYEQRCGRRAVIAALGAKGWNEVRSLTKTGIMEMFQHRSTPATELYAETIGQMAEKRAARRTTTP